jgi:hypothetical protein
VVEGISELSEGVLLGERYRLVRRLEVFSAGAERVAGAEYEYWTAVDVASETEVWIQFAVADGVYAEGAALAGSVAALRRFNHPAVPAVHAFGEYEFAREGELAAVGYCAVPAGAGETLAAALLRGELDQAEILVALGQVAEVLELLAEFELVHGRLGAHSVLLNATEGAGYEVVLADLPAALALETTLESELTAAVDVYALAWVIVLALVGTSVLEAEFGAGFAVTTAYELEQLAEETVGLRLAWAAEYLVALGVSSELAEVLLLALGEAGSRPHASVLTAALRAEWMLYAEGGAALEAEAVEAAAAAAVETVAAVEVAEAEEAAEVEEAVEVEDAVEVEEAAEVEEAGAAATETGATAATEVGEVAAAAAAAAAVTEVIPKVRQAARPKPARTAAASPSGPAGTGPGRQGAQTGTGAQRTAARKARPGVLIGGGVGLAIVIILIITFSTGGSKSANAASGSVATTGAAASVSASASASTASAAASASASASASAAASSASAGATATGPGYTFPATLETVPANAGEAVQEIKAAVSQAQGELSGAQQGQLGQVISTLTQEIGARQSLSTGLAQLWGLLHSSELPSSLNTYLIQLATYLSASQGS